VLLTHPIFTVMTLTPNNYRFITLPSKEGFTLEVTALERQQQEFVKTFSGLQENTPTELLRRRLFVVELWV
jgi:hypothetical protein